MNIKKLFLTLLIGLVILAAGGGLPAAAARAAAQPQPVPPPVSTQYNNDRKPNWYKTQYGTGKAWRNNCAPACAAMAILFQKQQDIPVQQVRNFCNKQGQWWTVADTKAALDHWKVNNCYRTVTHIAQLFTSIQSGHIIIACVDVTQISVTLSRTSRFNRHYTTGSGHFIILKGYLNNGAWMVVYDPWSLPDATDPDGSPAGQERYYATLELFAAIATKGSVVIEVDAGSA